MSDIRTKGAEMDDKSQGYEPAQGELVHLTVRAYFNGNYQVIRDSGERATILPGARCIVSVEKAPAQMPTRDHAVIRAIAGGGEHVLYRSSANKAPWFDCGQQNWLYDDEITSVLEVLFPGVAE